MFSQETLRKSEELAEKWQGEVLKRYQGREFKAITRSGIEVKPIYDARNIEGLEYEDIGLPGEYPYTRGIYSIHYQYQPWMTEQIIGYGTAKQLRERIDLLRSEGGARGYFGGEAFNIIFDQAGMVGYDPDDPIVMGRIGDTGVSICKAEDFEILFEGTDLTRTNVSLVCNNASPAMLALYIAAAERMKCPKEKLRGNIMNYLYCYFFMDSEYFKPQNAFKVMKEVVKYCTENTPLWNTVTLTEHNIAEAGANAVQSLAFILSMSIGLTEECIKAGLNPDAFLPRFGFHVRTGDNFFEDIGKIRALRRMWAKINRERFGCTNPRALQARIHAQTAGANMTVQQPLNNLVRTTIGALAMILAGVNGTQIDAYDEALGEPTEEAVTLSLRAQQIIEHETGIIDISDPLGGSYYLEWLTSEIEKKAYELIGKIDRMGGYIKRVESGWFHEQVTALAYRWRQEVEGGERVVVGVNKYQSDREEQIRVFQPDPEVERAAIEDVRRHRRERDNAKTQAALDSLKAEAMRVAQSDAEGELMEAMVKAAADDATLGEIMGMLREIFGTN